MQQALHIFKKDVRYLSGEILLVIALAGVFAWKLAAQWAEILLPIAAVYLIARLIHAEAIPGERQFWTTRPYRWQSLLAAKILFILAFVSGPTLVAICHPCRGLAADRRSCSDDVQHRDIQFLRYCVGSCRIFVQSIYFLLPQGSPRAGQLPMGA